MGKTIQWTRAVMKKFEKKYLDFLRKQEITGEPFYDKLGQLNKFYLPICDVIFKKFKKNRKKNIIGISGGQGSGKSTISLILKILLKEKYGLNTINFSIDDYYKTINSRNKLSKKISPLFLTRGVPGTHDIEMLFKDLKRLKKKNFSKISLPKFDKSLDNRLPKKKWTKINQKPDLIIFEGWCVGAKSQSNKELKQPINKLEREEDSNFKWRKTVNEKLKKNYQKVFKMINLLIFLKVPSFKYVLKWRMLQEQKLKFKSKGKKVMNKNEIKKFIMFYERITKSMIKKLTKSANIVIKLDPKHKLNSLKINK